MLVRHQDLTLRTTRTGRLTRWLGPALRGLLARRFKERVCAHPPAERAARWVHCAGCPHLADCPYGQAFEPESPPGRAPSIGREDVIRPVVLAPAFPQATLAPAGHAVAVRVLAVGAGAAAALPEMLAALADAGRTAGLGSDRVTFEVEPSLADDVELLPGELPAGPTPSRVGRLTVELTAPLFLRPEGGGKGPVIVPQLSDLVRASLRSVSELCLLYGEPARVDFAGLKELSRAARLVGHSYHLFSQPHGSSRQEARYPLRACQGAGVYADVPLALVPWLHWGGRLHVAGHRVMGAGAWRLVLD